MNLQLVLPVYFKFVKKWKYLLRKKKTNKIKQKDEKRKRKKTSHGESRTLDDQRDKWTRYLLRHNS